LIAASIVAPSADGGDSMPRADWGAPAVTVSHDAGTWTIAGRKHTALLDEKSLALTIRTASNAWAMAASGPKDMLVKAGAGADEFPLRLADAQEIEIKPYDTGFKTGVKLKLARWKHQNADLDLTLFLTLAFEGRDEELVCEAAADEHAVHVRQLDWPAAIDARDVNYTILPNGRGNLLPRDWSKEYYPIRSVKDGKIVASDHSLLQSHVIESWSMSWWGFQKRKAAMMVIAETPDDAAYQFEHPAGGPTVIGPRWLASLGQLRYPRVCRFCFFDDANYVTLAKRYRQHVMDTGLFVSLKEKMARTPMLADLIGVPQTRVGVLHNLSSESDRYDKENPSNNHSLTTFDQCAEKLRHLKEHGVARTLVFVSGWPHLGYDRQHPDPLPPPEEAGGWTGMKRLADACRELGYSFIFHDQYRDYYVDAPSFDTQFAIHEEDGRVPPRAFPGSRFGDSKEGQIPFMRHWDGGKQTYLNARYQSGHLRKNYQLFREHNIHPQGIYIDVIGYVPPDEDFNPEHPTTRSDAMRGQIDCLNWARANLGFTATEAGSDWVVPYVDCINQSGGNGKCIPVPLYNLVYHDAVLISYGEGRSGGQKNLLAGILCGGVPELPVSTTDETSLGLLRRMAALHKRVALLEMTGHEFLDKERHRERTSFADGTTVTVDWDAASVQIVPDVKVEANSFSGK
jgi:hypothetical protein